MYNNHQKKLNNVITILYTYQNKYFIDKTNGH